MSSRQWELAGDTRSTTWSIRSRGSLTDQNGIESRGSSKHGSLDTTIPGSRASGGRGGGTRRRWGWHKIKSNNPHLTDTQRGWCILGISRSKAIIIYIYIYMHSCIYFFDCFCDWYLPRCWYRAGFKLAPSWPARPISLWRPQHGSSGVLIFNQSILKLGNLVPSSHASDRFQEQLTTFLGSNFFRCSDKCHVLQQPLGIPRLWFLR